MRYKPKGMEIQQLLSRLKANWYWFLIAALLGLFCGVLYNAYTNPTYQASTTILIKTDDKSGALKSLYKDLGINEKVTSIQNQVGVLSSYNLNLKTLQNLNWDVSWYKNSLFSKTDLYQNGPFKVEHPDYFDQVQGVPIYIKPISDVSYQLSYDGAALVKGFNYKLKYKGEVKFGEAFVNEYFNFKLSKPKGRPVESGTEYILVFNNTPQLALEYQDKLDIKLVDKDAELINVKLDGEQVGRTVDYLNALGQEYILFGLSERDRIADNTVLFIDSLISNIDSSLQIAGNEFTDFRTRNRVVDIGKESSLVIEKSKNVGDQEAIAKIKLAYYTNLKKYLRNPDKIKTLMAPSVVGVTDPALNSLVLKLSDLSSQREVQSYTLQENNPKLIALDKEIAYTQNELSENINNLLSNTQLELSNLTKQKNDIYAEQSALPKKEQNYINIKRSFDLNNDLYNFLLQRRVEAGIMKASHEPEAQIIDPARADSVKLIGHYGLINLIIGMVAGLVLAFLYFLIRNQFDHSIQNISEVENALDLPVSGMIKHNKSQSGLPAFELPGSDVAESFRDLRMKLSFLDDHLPGSKIFSINSNTSGEGKAFVSSNLAAILAIDNKSTLLIDADLRRPALHYTFRTQNQLGLSNYLKNEADFDQVITKTNINNLSVITTGPVTEYPSEWLNNGKLQILLEKARKQFDYIVIKNPPSGLISDALLIEKLADVNIYLLKFKHSTTHQIEYINDLAKPGLLKNIIVVLNDVSPSNGLINKQSYDYYK
ncbi:MAG TPA: polysaccharide biosynthesis tyrosine autokinase [Puia sp.]|nr:polysaccharide biosynthesis tyrosine autokinase [Puia sp.]